MIVIYLIWMVVLIGVIYLGYKLGVLRWRRRKAEKLIAALPELVETVTTVSRGLSDTTNAFTVAVQSFPRLCNDGQYRSFTPAHDEMIEKNTTKYRQMKFGGNK